MEIIDKAQDISKTQNYIYLYTMDKHRIVIRLKWFRKFVMTGDSQTEVYGTVKLRERFTWFICTQ
jgi:hypothetical protein